MKLALDPSMLRTVPLLELPGVVESAGVNIEHEDQELDQIEGLRQAAATLIEAVGR